MDREQLLRGGLLALSILLLYLGFRILQPFLITVLLALVTVFIFYPLYRRITPLILRERLASVLMLLLILLVIVIPSGVIVTKLIRQSSAAYRAFLDADLEPQQLPLIQDLSPELQDWLVNAASGLVSKLKDYIVFTSPNLVGEVANVALHLFVFLFVLYYGFLQGPAWYKAAHAHLPLRPEFREVFLKDLEKATSAIVHGQFLTAVVQGILGGILFAVFGIPNPIFWGFIMVIFAFVPFLGTPMIIVPAGVIELFQGNYLAGLGVLIIGLGIVMNIDNLLRPYFVSKFSNIHPLVVLLGVLGGLRFFGLAGIILGPLVLALLVTLLRDLLLHDPKQHEIKEYENGENAEPAKGNARNLPTQSTRARSRS